MPVVTMLTRVRRIRVVTIVRVGRSSVFRGRMVVTVVMSGTRTRVLLVIGNCLVTGFGWVFAVFVFHAFW